MKLATGEEWASGAKFCEVFAIASFGVCCAFGGEAEGAVIVDFLTLWRGYVIGNDAAVDGLIRIIDNVETYGLISDFLRGCRAGDHENSE